MQSHQDQRTTENHSSLSKARWQCKYYVIFIPKYHRKRLYGVVKRRSGEVFHRLAEQKGCRIGEGHVMPYHVHMLIDVPPKLAVSSVIGYIKGKIAIRAARGERGCGGFTMRQRDRHTFARLGHDK